jgi:cytoskeletal protein CcmA (bactofilin family)
MTTIGASLVITGQVTSREDMTVHGKVKGQISMAEGGLLVGPSGTVEADVHVPRATIHGTFSGDIAAAERVELTPTARARGTVVSPSVLLQEGAVFNGAIAVERQRGGSASKQQAKAV